MKALRSIIWFYGNTGAGKTFLAQNMDIEDKIILDGDDLRKCWILGFSKEDREEQNWRAAMLADMLKNQGYNVCVATICPYIDLRKSLADKFPDIRWIHVEGGHPPTEKYPFECGEIT